MIAEAVRFNLAELQADLWKAQNPFSYEYGSAREFYNLITTPDSMTVYRNWENASKNPALLSKTPAGLKIQVPWIP